MPADMPYMPSSGNVPKILEKMQTAGTPPKFTLEFLKSTLGFTASQDRGMLKVLKQLGFLTADGTPTDRYNEFRSSTVGGLALAAGLREGWAPLFLADEKANERSTSALKEMFKSITGQGESAAEKMAATFKALAGKADWTPQERSSEAREGDSIETDNGTSQDEGGDRSPGRLSLHHDIHVHLPPSSDVAVYKAIFRALRDELM